MCTYFKKMKIKSLTKKINYLAEKRINGQPKDADIAKEITLHKKLAKVYGKLSHKKKFPHATTLARECYRNAAALEDAEARYQFAKEMIELGRFWDGLAETFFKCKAHEKHAVDAYEEGFVFLKAAIAQGHHLAKRLHGMAYINGWGVDADQDHGFELVISSIEDAGEWDKATQVFEELGLNRPEFFAYMSSRKRK